jgi:hypothetical protein
LGFCALAFFFGAASLRLYLLLLPQAFVRSTAVADSVVHGEPPWRMFQSRVLGPYLVHAVAVLTRRELPEAYAWIALALLFATGLAVLVMTRGLRDPERPALGSFLVFYAGFFVLLPCIWLYVWDLIALLVFWMFQAFVMRRPPWWAFVVLFAFAVLNHELGLAIAGWMTLDPLVRWLAGRRHARHATFDRASFLAGVASIAAGIGLIESLRRALLVHLSPPAGASELAPNDLGEVHLTLGQNGEAIARSFTLAPGDTYQFVVPLFLLAVVVLAIRLWILDAARYGALALMTLAMVASFLCFGLVLETRVLMPLVPFVAMHGWAATRGRAAA